MRCVFLITNITAEVVAADHKSYQLPLFLHFDSVKIHLKKRINIECNMEYVVLQMHSVLTLDQDLCD